MAARWLFEACRVSLVGWRAIRISARKGLIQSPTMDPASEAPASFEFGRFRVLPRRREVLADGQPMELGGRAFDILVVLIEAHGAVVSKDELMRRVWPGRIVEDNNLHAQIKALRRAFSDHDLIRTVVGRGYQFRAEVRPRLGNHIERAQPGTASNVSAPRR